MKVTWWSLGVLLLACPSAAAQDWFDAPQYLRDVFGGEMRARADLDADGDVDLVHFEGSTVGATWIRFRVLFNDGAGNFTPGTWKSLPSRAAIWTPRLGDVTGDGLPDVVLANFPSAGRAPGVDVYPSTGGGQFGARVHLDVEGVPYDTWIADVDGNGIADIAVHNHLATIGSVEYYVLRWFLAEGGTSFTPGMGLTITERVTLAELDVNGDGTPDLVGGKGGGCEVFFYPTVGGAPTQGPSFCIDHGPGSGSRVPYVADADGDQDLDVLVYGQERLTVLENLGAGAFTVRPSQALSLMHAHVGDWDGDGDPDLLNHVPDYGDPIGRGELVLVENDGIGTFTPAASLPMLGLGGGAGPSDLNGDGRLDFAGSATLAFGRGGFRTAGTPLTDTPFLARDWEDDGDVDLLGVDGRVWVNDATGIFTETAYLWPAPPADHGYDETAAIADLDGDGHVDHLVGYFEFVGPFGFPEFREMRLLAGDGAGGFVDRGAALPAGTQVGSTVTGHIVHPVYDLDGDGSLDLLRPGGYWANDGSGYFPVFTTLFAGWRPGAVADVDGDGDLDLLGTQNARDLALLRNTGGLVFVPEVLLASTTPLWGSGRFADLDEDGDLDVVIGEVGAAVHLVENEGGVFTPAVELPTALYHSGTVYVTDVDGDGRMDVVAGPFEEGGNATTFAVFRRDGPGLAYDSARHYLSRAVRQIADVDADGDPDLLGEVAVRSRRHDGADAGAVRQYGSGFPGTGDAVPVLGASGPTRPGEAVVLRLRRGVGDTLGYLAVGLTESAVLDSPLPGLTSYAEPWLLGFTVHVIGDPAGTGDGRFSLPFVVPPVLAGRSYYHQMFLLDGAAPHGVTSSNGLEIRYGR